MPIYIVAISLLMSLNPQQSLFHQTKKNILISIQGSSIPLSTPNISILLFRSISSSFLFRYMRSHQFPSSLFSFHPFYFFFFFCMMLCKSFLQPLRSLCLLEFDVFMRFFGCYSLLFQVFIACCWNKNHIFDVWMQFIIWL